MEKAELELAGQQARETQEHWQQAAEFFGDNFEAINKELESRTGGWLDASCFTEEEMAFLRCRANFYGISEGVEIFVECDLPRFEAEELQRYSQ